MPVESPRLVPHFAAARLMQWYGQSARELPWRTGPGSAQAPDPYRVWLAEIMLQQTTVEAAKEPFRRFVGRWPSVEALASAATDEVMAAWSGLGYYARARNLVACARAVAAAGGRFPQTVEELRALPGIGPYTAAAIAAIAFGAVTVPVDANLARVGARVFGIGSSGPRLHRDVGRALEACVPAERPGDFAQALMDLGATICRPRAPACDRCPLAEGCVARLTGRTGELPVRLPRRLRPKRFGTVWWVEARGHVALVRRPPRGLLGGMLGLPGTPWMSEAVTALPFPGAWTWAQQPVVHGFTHFDLQLEVAAIRIDTEQQFGAGMLWVERDRIEGLPTVFAKAAAVGQGLAGNRRGL